MGKLILISFIFSISAQSFASDSSDQVQSCAAHIIEKMEYNPGRAEKLCSTARKLGTDTSDFSLCLTDINSETKLAPELISPYCLKRPDVAYRECVVSTFKANSKDNAFKSCLSKKAGNIAKFRHHDVENTRLAAPTKAKISVGYVKDNYSLEN